MDLFTELILIIGNYLVVFFSVLAGADWPRVVRPVLRRARHVICRMCRHDGSLGEAVISKGKHSKYVKSIYEF